MVAAVPRRAAFWSDTDASLYEDMLGGILKKVFEGIQVNSKTALYALKAVQAINVWRLAFPQTQKLLSTYLCAH